MTERERFWRQYLMLQRRTVAVLASAELSLFVIGQILALRYRYSLWHPAIIVDYLVFAWPPLFLTGAYLVFLFAMGAITERLGVTPRASWLLSAIPAAIVAVYAAWAMYESTK